MSTAANSLRFARPERACTIIPARSFTPRRVLQVITPSHMSGAETAAMPERAVKPRMEVWNEHSRVDRARRDRRLPGRLPRQG